jgi:LacI family transcriptional regulator
MPGSAPRSRVAMSDVARRAGVSVTTVSHVVNRTRSVAPETERAVLAAIAETGYVSEDVVRSVRTIRSQTVGLAMTAMSNPYFGDVVHSIERALSRAGYAPLLAETHDDVAAELRAVSDLLSRRVEAIILAPSADPTRALEHARARGVPVVLIDRAAPLDVDQVVTENVEPTAFLVDHLVGVGHRRIAMISGKAGLTTTEERVQGYRLGLSRNRIRFDKALVVPGHSTDDGGQLALHQLWQLPKRPTAVLVGNNRMTIGAMHAAREASIDIPADLALVSFDDFEWADFFRPGLTVIAQPTKSLGEQAAELAVSRLADPTLPSRRVVLRPRFVHRDSCGCDRSAGEPVPAGSLPQ